MNIRSVIVFGRMHIVEDEETKRKICTDLSLKFTDDEEYLKQEFKKFFSQVCCLELVPEYITGKLVNES